MRNDRTGNPAAIADALSRARERYILLSGRPPMYRWHNHMITKWDQERKMRAAQGGCGVCGLGDACIAYPFTDQRTPGRRGMDARAILI